MLLDQFKKGSKMKVILERETYLANTDILVRVYENQSSYYKEEEQCVGEILFRPKLQREHIYFSAPFPRGLVEAIDKAFEKIVGDYIIQISNELPYQIGVLTSCDEHFDIRLKNSTLLTKEQ